MKSRICPTCKRELPAGPGSSPFGSFCSERCRLVDLGAWLSESYRISAPVAEEDMDQGARLDDEGDPTSRSN
jgi:endogenous inhibitor of DNA gyrase (YacG/DUF329 family)